MDLNPGDIFAEKYEIQAELGQGAFAVVYLANDREIRRQVAIKILKEGRSDDRFVREAKLLSELRSPHTVTLIDFGRTADASQPYIVSEFVRGETLEDRLARVGMMPGGRVAHIIRQILQSLAEAHERGIVHRDIKPANIMMTEVGGDEDFVKVVDFGVAKPLSDVRDVSVELTVAGQLIGTMRYMAPEQLRGDRVAQPASDVYAVGLIAYELLTNEKAAAGDDAHFVMTQHLSQDKFVIPFHLDVPMEFRRAFETMMEKSVELRPRNAGDALRLFDQEHEEETMTFDALAEGRDRAAGPSNPELQLDSGALRDLRSRTKRGTTSQVPQQEEPPPERSTVSTFLLVAIAILSFAVVLMLGILFLR